LIQKVNNNQVYPIGSGVNFKKFLILNFRTMAVSENLMKILLKAPSGMRRGPPSRSNRQRYSG